MQENVASSFGRPRVLTIAGVDPSGGAGIIADIKSIGAFGGYAMAVVAALTAQNTKHVQAIEPVTAEFLRQQLDTLTDDVVVDAVKIGLLSSSAIDVVIQWLDANRPNVVVVDPVMVATSGDRLLDSEAELKLRDLSSRATIVTPNLPELATLCQTTVAQTEVEAINQARNLQAQLGCNVFVKLGHLSQRTVANDYIVTKTDLIRIESPWVTTNNTHGTGCSLSSALATLLVYFGDQIQAAATVAKNWLSKSIAQGEVLGVGGKNSADTAISHGPLDHLQAVVPTSFINFANLLTTDILERIEQMPFIRNLASGELDRAQFASYLVQDNLYLAGYQKLAHRAAKLSSSQEHRNILNSLAGQDIAQEIAFHNDWLERNGFSKIADGGARVATTNYLNILDTASCSSEYAITLAALLPCAYMYLIIAQNLASQVQALGVDLEMHPYRAWIDAYCDPSYEVLVNKLVQITNQVATEVDSDTRYRMLQIYRQAGGAEYDFFNFTDTQC